MPKPAVCVLSDIGTIRFSGDEAQTFLHNQITTDITLLTPERSAYGAYCTPKGRVLASFLLWRSPEGYFMQLPSSLREPIQQQLSRFILRAKVKAADVTGDRVLIGVSGENAAALVQKVTGHAPQHAHGVAHTPSAVVMRIPGDRFEVAVTKDKAPGILEALATVAERKEPEHWDRLDILAGIPTVTPATQEAFVPQMINLDLIGGVSFEKGCYPGQEIVARMHYRGTLKQRLYLAHMDSEKKPQPGDKLYSSGFGDQASGTIVNAAPSLQGGHDALAVIQISGARSGEIHWGSPQGAVLDLLPLPYQVP